MKKAILGLLLATSFALCCCKDSNVHLYSNDNKYIVDDFLTVTILWEPQERLLSNDFNLFWIISITSKGNEPISEEASSFKLLDETTNKTIDFEYTGPSDEDPFYDSEINYLRMYTFNATAKKSASSLKCCFYFSFKGINFLYHSYDK